MTMLHILLLISPILAAAASIIGISQYYYDTSVQWQYRHHKAELRANVVLLMIAAAAITLTLGIAAYVFVTHPFL